MSLIGGGLVKLASSSSTGSLNEKSSSSLLSATLPRSNSELRITDKTTLQPLSPLSFIDEENEFRDEEEPNETIEESLNTPPDDDNSIETSEGDNYPEFRVDGSDIKTTIDYLRIVNDSVDLDKETDSEHSDEELDLTSNSV